METTCQISLEAIGKNYQYFAERMSPSHVIPVVKANAYGHGAIRVSKYLMERFSPQLFAVATLEEAQELCQANPDLSVLIFSRVFPTELSQVPAKAILTIGSLEDAKALSGSSRSSIEVHLNVNTGMNRLGLSPQHALELIQSHDPHLKITGVYSHFSSSDTAAETTFTIQTQRFAAFCADLRSLNFQGMNHFCNSAAALHHDAPRYDAMRLGIGLYGYDTSPGGTHQNHLTPAMTIKAPLVRVETIDAGESVSYAERWVAANRTNIGTLRIGYADGYNRLLTNRGVVGYQGKVYTVIGTVTMDHIMVDLGADDVPTGSEFTVMGGGNISYSIATVARQLNTIPYEVCCAISSRVRRDYF